MERINIGVINLVVSNLMKESLIDKSLLNETKKTTSKFFEVVKNSPILQLEFKVYNNLESKHIDSDILATRYIDNNIKLFEVYTLEELNEEHQKIDKFIELKDQNLNESKLNLYNSINTLITESLKISDEIDVDQIHESFNTVLEHIKKSKEVEKTNIPENINEEVVEIAINKFNEKYEKMDEDEVKLFKLLVNANDEKKKELFEQYKTENVETLTTLNGENTSDKISKSLQKLTEMKFVTKSADSDIVKLHELKKGLI